MLNTDLFWAADWEGAYTYLTRGEFPLILQLLAINTIAIAVLVVRAITSKNRLRATSAYIVQGILVLANLVVLTQNETMTWLNQVI